MKQLYDLQRTNNYADYLKYIRDININKLFTYLFIN